MWPRRDGLRLLTVLAVAAAGCGAEVPHGGAVAPGTTRPRGKLHATDLIPGDLDLVVRVDLGLVRRSLGPTAAEDLQDRALERGGDDVVRAALAVAEVTWVGLRLSDLEAGDRVLVVESKAVPAPDPTTWQKGEAPLPEGVTAFRANGEPPRASTAIILRFADAAVFATPVQAPSVERVLRAGPDHDRGQPEARGMLSLDWRARRLSEAFHARFPSLASLVDGIDRVRAHVALTGATLELEGRVLCKSDQQAARVERVLEAIRATGQEVERYAELLGALRLERVASALHVRWPVPPAAVQAWLADGPGHVYNDDTTPPASPTPEPP